MSRESLLSSQICRLLDQSADALDPTVLERLRAGRERALLRHQPAATPHEIVGTAGSASLLFGQDNGGTHPVRNLLLMLALLLGVAFAYYWNGFNQAADNEEIDSALLVDELPPNAYLDRGFQAWLEKNTSTEQ